ncbi:META domain-containing protein [Nocardia terpenica]|uniref:DUF306 domain-containing protein n=1 Tax=Nocardia terpenica TaxID=455432 RepID=A0A291RLP2_9NOCA|nr:META domain-containing protein [Nocardia terpenica]ATL68493.1 hypothetical protein CRH09_22190 [Nocardia terpenica]
MSANLLRVVWMLAATGLAAACTTQHPAAAAQTPMGRTFVSTRVIGPPIPGGGPLTLTFADGRVSAEAGCNASSGPVTFDGPVLRVTGLATTMMACPGDRGGADGWQVGLLQSAPVWKLNGDTLTLIGTTTSVTLVDKKLAQPDRPITRTTWVVTTLLRPNGQVRTTTLDEVLPTLTIAPDGAVTGDAGCNRMTGTADLAADGGTATFRLATTKMLCAPEVMDVERQVLEALDGETRLDVDSDTLTIRNTGNNTGLILRAE